MKLKLEIDGLDYMAKRLKDLGGNVRQASEKALKAAHAEMTPGIHTAMSPHRQTGKTEGSIVEQAKVEWAGDMASVPVGFNIRKDGLPSIFLMYGTPRMKKDQKLYNTVYGKAVREKIAQTIANVMDEEVKKYL